MLKEVSAHTDNATVVVSEIVVPVRCRLVCIPGNIQPTNGLKLIKQVTMKMFISKPVGFLQQRKVVKSNIIDSKKLIRIDIFIG